MMSSISGKKSSSSETIYLVVGRWGALCGGDDFVGRVDDLTKAVFLKEDVYPSRLLRLWQLLLKFDLVSISSHSLSNSLRLPSKSSGIYLDRVVGRNKSSSTLKAPLLSFSFGVDLYLSGSSSDFNLR